MSLAFAVCRERDSESIYCTVFASCTERIFDGINQ